MDSVSEHAAVDPLTKLPEDRLLGKVMDVKVFKALPNLRYLRFHNGKYIGQLDQHYNKNGKGLHRTGHSKS
jgi:hypothetical protein